MHEMRYPAWEKPYRKVIREADRQRLHKLMQEAEGAIFESLQRLSDSPNGAEEREAIRKACDNLLRIRTDILGWPSFDGQQIESQADAEPR